MKSRTSFSKLAPFKKDITRFAPIWALYLIGMMLIFFESSRYPDYDRFARNYLPDIISGYGIVNLFYAGVCAAMLYGDLYNTRMCYSLHTMPQRRETWLLSHLAAGMLFSLVPNLLASVYLMFQLEDYWFLALYWLLATQLQFVFFFGVATLSALLTGSRFAMLLVYAGLNFFSLLGYVVMLYIYEPMLVGVTTNLTPFAQFCPTYYLMENFDYLTFKTIETYTGGLYGGYSTFYEYTGLGTGWGYMAIIAAVGAALMGLSFLLYRWRHLESAGDFVAFRKLNPPACLIMTVCVAVVFAFFGEIMGSGYVIWMSVGVVVGYFGSLMLLERRIKVFRPKVFLWFGVLCACIFASIMAVKLDIFGIVDWTPSANQVESVTIANYNSNNYYDDMYYYSNRMSVTLTDPEQIEDIIEAHKDILDRLEENRSGVPTHYVVLQYKLRSGRTVKRAYSAPANGINYSIICEYFYTPEQILGYTNWEEYVKNVSQIYLDGGEIPSLLYEPLLEALKTDCENGAVVTDYSDMWLSLDIEIKNPNGSRTYRSLSIKSTAEKTKALLNTPEFILGYSDWDAYLQSIDLILVLGVDIPKEEYAALLDAVRKDCENGSITWQNGKYCAYEIAIDVTYPNKENLYRYIPIPSDADNTISWVKENLE